MRPQPIPIIEPTVILPNGSRLKLASGATQHVPRVARDTNAEIGRSLEDRKFGDSPTAYVSAAAESVQTCREAAAVLDGAKRHLNALRVGIDILTGTSISYPAILASKPIVAAALEMRATADCLRAFDPQAAEAELGPIIDGLRQVETQLTGDIATAEKRIAAAETEARRCAGAAYAASAGHAEALKRFTELGLKDMLPRDWPKGITAQGAAQLVKDAVSQRQMARHEKRDSKNTAEAVAKIMREG
ncbi:hypothetical protein [Paracoccus sp. KR1-242]|uniref:hypothetical protein n=1 Tax=Paracoccus sp. KR1-242 TaxID=3410028 RepID=UPI003C0F8074